MKTNIYGRSLAIVLAASMIGCGQYKSAGAGSYSSTAALDVDTKDIDTAATEAQVAMDSASATLNTVVDENGKIHLFSKASTSEVQTQFALSGIKTKLIEKLDLVVAKINLVKAKFNLARQKVADTIAKLNPADPAQAALIAALTSQMGKIDLLEQKFFDGVHMLAGKLDFALSALDKLSLTAGTAAGAVNPILGVVVGAATWLVVGQIKGVILDFKAKLMAL